MEVIQAGDMLEYVDAFVIFENAIIIDFEEDTANGNPLENQGDGIFSPYWNHDPTDAGQDEVFADYEANNASIHLRVNTADDGFILHYECVDLCPNGVVDYGEECDDGNDIDDDDCSNNCTEVTECNDKKDNDCDGLIDYPDDPFCDSPEDDQEIGYTECDDCIDNDGDGLMDFHDPGCKHTKFDDSEYNSVIYGCSDGLDNDDDGLIDKDDPGCYSSGKYYPRDNNEQDRFPQCRDYFDNDNDGLVDLYDPDCLDKYDALEGPE